jgi:hypothetical protein
MQAVLVVLWLLGSPAQVPRTSPTTLRITGTIEKYDPATRILSLSTVSGGVTFEVTPLVHIHQGWQMVEASELVRWTGFPATVRFSESSGVKTVRSIRIGRGHRVGLEK